MLGGWDECLIDQASEVPSIIFLIISSKCFAKNLSIYFSIFFLTLKKLKMNGIDCQQPTGLFSITQNNIWTIRHLVDETSYPAYCIENCWISRRSAVFS